MMKLIELACLSLEVQPKDYYWGRSAYLRDPDAHLKPIRLTGFRRRPRRRGLS